MTQAAEIEIMAKDVGTWTAEVEVYVGPQPSKSTGTMTTRLACGGTWLVSDYEAASGFGGHGMWTWDAAKQKYVGVWADNQMTFVAPGEGTWDAASRTMTYVYAANVKGKDMRWKQTTQSIGDDTRVFLSFMPETAEKPMMQVTYRRKR